ncbi:hypothetical protein F5Y18DRAFT_23311 [Xylariaceae sp. FL1019]|nr:hypothetical protein F5Y18DRAFT_23311 [Xylariaceae sp. FL1019]
MEQKLPRPQRDDLEPTMSFSQSPLTPAETDLSNDELGGSPFDSVMERQMNLLGLAGPNHVPQDANTAPLFTAAVLKHTRDNSSSPNIPYSQYGFLAGDVERLLEGSTADPRIFYNVSAPSSVFICGSQGSGKSHTLSCILEDCLIQSDTLGTLRNPLTAVVFHYDDYASDLRVAPCEAAYLGSDPSVSVRVLCAPTNVALIKESYRIFPNATVEPLKLDESNLNTRRMLELMAFDKTQPLYMQVLQRILRDMRLEQQVTRGGFRYSEFKRRLISEDLLPTQKQVLQQRLDTLESFMVESQTSNSEGKKPGEKKKKKKKLVRGTNWNPKVSITVPCCCPFAMKLFTIHVKHN